MRQTRTLTEPESSPPRRGPISQGTALAEVVIVLAAAFGEEVFFRGYVQTRLNESFPRRFALRGIRFGAGLVLAALLFGLLHAFNTVDYFSGRYTFAWTLAGSTAFTGFLFGLLREATGSVAPGVVVHFLNNLLWFTVMPPGALQWLSKN